jgi:hypothetical protein
MQNLDSPISPLNAIVPEDGERVGMELLSDAYHLRADELRELIVDVLNWLDWSIAARREENFEVSVATELGEALLEMEIVACGTTTNPADAHCLSIHFPQSATGSVGVLLDELHAAALKKSEV